MKCIPFLSVPQELLHVRERGDLPRNPRHAAAAGTLFSAAVVNFALTTEEGPDSGAKVLALKTALKLALDMALDFLHWKKSENG